MTKKQLSKLFVSLESIQYRLSQINLDERLEYVKLNYCNCSVAGQISCAVAALECILQENVEDLL